MDLIEKKITNFYSKKNGKRRVKIKRKMKGWRNGKVKV